MAKAHGSVVARRPNPTLHVIAIHDVPFQGLAEWAIEHAQPITASPGGPGALDDRPLSYGVINGERVQAELPALWQTFRKPEFLVELGELMDGPLVPYPYDRAFINLNVLQPGQDYQLHTDGCDVTLIIFLTDASPEDGGELQCLLPSEVMIEPRKGTGVLFSAGVIPHRVMPLRAGALTRVSMPIAYSYAHSTAVRDPRLDGYLFSPHDGHDAEAEDQAPPSGLIDA